MPAHFSEQSPATDLFGSLMIDLQACSIGASEQQMLNDPRVGGVILFSRNFQSKDQLLDLVKAIRESSPSPLLLAVDHEGGRVQRFREGFTAIPAMRRLGDLYQQSPDDAQQAAVTLGGLLAAELAEIDIDFSFTPVVDLDSGASTVIGDRAFHQDPRVVGELASSLMQGLHSAGMAAVAKHFPGHGYVAADSHLELPVDHRSFDEIDNKDLLPFKTMIAAGVEGIMPAHIVYSQLATEPAGFSNYWLQTVLRHKLQFRGAIFSDDLSMQGAVESGSPSERADLALAAGCDMLLVCNDSDAALEVLQHSQLRLDDARSQRLASLRRKDSASIADFRQATCDKAKHVISRLSEYDE